MTPFHLTGLTDCSGVDFDDPDYGFKEEDKPGTKVSRNIHSLKTHN